MMPIRPPRDAPPLIDPPGVPEFFFDGIADLSQHQGVVGVSLYQKRTLLAREPNLSAYAASNRIVVVRLFTPLPEARVALSQLVAVAARSLFRH